VRYKDVEEVVEICGILLVDHALNRVGGVYDLDQRGVRNGRDKNDRYGTHCGESAPLFCERENVSVGSICRIAITRNEGYPRSDGWRMGTVSELQNFRRKADLHTGVVGEAVLAKMHECALRNNINERVKRLRAPQPTRVTPSVPAPTNS